MFPKTVSFTATGSTSATTTFYVPVPVRCIVRGAQAAASVDPGDADTIVFSKATTEVGTLTYGTDIAAGATGTYAAHATQGETVFAAGDVIKVVISQLDAAATFQGYIILDENVLTVQ